MSAQTGERSATPTQYLSQDQQWQAFAEEVINQDKSSFAAKGLKEQMALIKDATDYLWYTIRYCDTYSSIYSSTSIASAESLLSLQI